MSVTAPRPTSPDRTRPIRSPILSVAMLLDWLARKHGREAFAQAAALIDSAVDTLLADPARRTADLGGRLGTKSFADALCGELGKRGA